MNLKRYIGFDTPRGPQLPNFFIIGALFLLHYHFEKRRKE
jgi:hypothetical protein